jgi:hypothetical protein
MSAHTIVDKAPFSSIITWSVRDATEKRRLFDPFDESRCGRLGCVVVPNRGAVDGGSVQGGAS